MSEYEGLIVVCVMVGLMWVAEAIPRPWNRIVSLLGTVVALVPLWHLWRLGYGLTTGAW